jgi:DNA-binding MarR family transcriptional regulator
MGQINHKLMPSDLIGFKVRKLHNLLGKQWNQLSNQYDLRLSPVQAGILVFIDEHTGLTQKSLAGLLGVDASTLSQALQPLLDRSFIQKKSDPVDRRKLQMVLSNEGQQLIEVIKKVFAERQKHLPGNLNLNELQTLHALLDKMIK